MILFLAECRYRDCPLSPAELAWNLLLREKEWLHLRCPAVRVQIRDSQSANSSYAKVIWLDNEGFSDLGAGLAELAISIRGSFSENGCIAGWSVCSIRVRAFSFYSHRFSVDILPRRHGRQRNGIGSISSRSGCMDSLSVPRSLCCDLWDTTFVRTHVA